MAVKYGFFNSVNGDRKYNADDISNYFLKLISNGVFATPADAMQVQTLSDGMKVKVTPGWGFINCKWIENQSDYILTLDAADVVLNRVDRIVLRLDSDSEHRSMGIYIKKGNNASSAIAPSLTRNSTTWELSLARIFIGAGTSVISQSNIRDERPNTDLCGFVTGLIDQIDTTNLFAQYNTAFYDWFNTIVDEVRSTTIVMGFTSSYTTTTENERQIPINIPQYSTTLDILTVYVNGMKLIPSVDYTSNASTVTLTRPLSVAGTKVEINVIKSVDTSEAASIAAIVYELLENAVTHTELETRLHGLSFIKISKAAFDGITEKDPNTIYYVYDSSGNIKCFMGDVEITGETSTGGSAVGLMSGSITQGTVGEAQPTQGV